MLRSELLEDYCQRCGSPIGSFECCQSTLNKRMRAEPEDPHDDPSLEVNLEG